MRAPLALMLFVLGTAACKEAKPPVPPQAPEPPPAEAASQPAPPPAAEAASRPAEPPPPVSPAADAPDPVSPYVLDALTPGALCRYEFSEVMSEQLGGDAYAGRELKVEYVLRAKPGTKKAPIVFEAEVEQITAKGQREGVKFDLDAMRPADLQRVSGGADATVEPQLSLVFAMLGQKVTIELDERGALKSVKGAGAIRKRFLAYHPPAPRKHPHYVAKAKLRASDQAIASIFLPYATDMFADGEITEGRKDTAKLEVLHPDHRADAMRGRRVKASGKRIMFQSKWQFVPSKKAHTVPKQVDEPLKNFLGGDGSALIAFEAKNPCFLQAARTWNYKHVWQGLVESEPVDSERLRTETLIWRKR